MIVNYLTGPMAILLILSAAVILSAYPVTTSTEIGHDLDVMTIEPEERIISTIVKGVKWLIKKLMQKPEKAPAPAPTINLHFTVPGGHQEGTATDSKAERNTHKTETVVGDNSNPNHENQTKPQHQQISRKSPPSEMEQQPQHKEETHHQSTKDLHHDHVAASETANHHGTNHQDPINHLLHSPHHDGIIDTRNVEHRTEKEIKAHESGSSHQPSNQDHKLPADSEGNHHVDHGHPKHEIKLDELLEELSHSHNHNKEGEHGHSHDDGKVERGLQEHHAHKHQHHGDAIIEHPERKHESGHHEPEVPKENGDKHPHHDEGIEHTKTEHELGHNGSEVGTGHPDILHSNHNGVSAIPETGHHVEHHVANEHQELPNKHEHPNARDLEHDKAKPEAEHSKHLTHSETPETHGHEVVESPEREHESRHSVPEVEIKLEDSNKHSHHNEAVHHESSHSVHHGELESGNETKHNQPEVGHKHSHGTLELPGKEHVAAEVTSGHDTHMAHHEHQHQQQHHNHAQHASTDSEQWPGFNVDFKKLGSYLFGSKETTNAESETAHKVGSENSFGPRQPSHSINTNQEHVNRTDEPELEHAKLRTNINQRLLEISKAPQRHHAGGETPIKKHEHKEWETVENDGPADDIVNEESPIKMKHLGDGKMVGPKVTHVRIHSIKRE